MVSAAPAIEELPDEWAIAIRCLVPASRFIEVHGQEAPEQFRVKLKSGAWAVTREFFEDFIPQKQSIWRLGQRRNVSYFA